MVKNHIRLDSYKNIWSHRIRQSLAYKGTTKKYKIVLLWSATTF